MKFAILAFAALFAKFASASAAAKTLDLKPLKFVLYGRHKDPNAQAGTVCPLGDLPDTVFLHKSVKHNDHFFTWVKPVHGLVNKVVCGASAVWDGLAGELLLDLHFFGNKDSEKFLHLEHLTGLGGVAHVFLKFAAGANATGAVLGHAKFVAGVHALMGADFKGVAALPAHFLLHDLVLHA